MKDVILKEITGFTMTCGVAEISRCVSERLTCTLLEEKMKYVREIRATIMRRSARVAMPPQEERFWECDETPEVDNLKKQHAQL